MLILSSFGFGYTQNRMKIAELIQDKTGKMLIIPLACEFEEETGEKEKNCAVLGGFVRDNIYVFNERSKDELLSMKFDYIAVLGGNTFKLLHYVKKYHLDDFIKEQVTNGAVYLGFSAGAYLACGNIEYVKNFDDNNHITDGDFNGLGFTDKYILCHFDYRGTEEIKMCRKYLGDDVELITINNNEIITFDN